MNIQHNKKDLKMVDEINKFFRLMGASTKMLLDSSVKLVEEMKELRAKEGYTINEPGSLKKMTKQAALDFAVETHGLYPEIVSTKISLIHNEKTNETVILQTMLDGNKKTVYDKSGENIVGRELTGNISLSSEIREMMEDGMSCVIPFPVNKLTFEQVLDYAKKLRETHKTIAATMITKIENDDTKTTNFIQTMLDDDGNTLYVDDTKNELVGRMLPPNTQLCDKLCSLIENDVKCVISIQK